MTRHLRLIATVIATIGLLAATVGSVSAGKPSPMTKFYVYSAESSLDSGDLVTVTRKTSAPGGQNDFGTCTKPADDPHTCASDGSLLTFSRTDATYPWVVD